MKFDMNRAWSDALALFAANREVIAVIGGVFFLLPGFAAQIFFADTIAQAWLEYPPMVETARATGKLVVTPAITHMLGLSVLVALVNLFGVATLLGLLNDRARPTLGQALALAGKTMPTLFGAILLFVVGLVLASVAITLVGIPAQLLLGPELGGSLTMIVLTGAMFYACTRLSMTLPLAVIEKMLNPVAALWNSWRMTRGRAWSLLGFYLLLTLGLGVISLVLDRMVYPVLEEVFGGATFAVTAVDLIAGVVSALVNVLFACLVAAIYRQLAAPDGAK